MFCRNCGKEVHPLAVACPSCGVPPLVEKKFCSNCGSATQTNQAMCVKCGFALVTPPATVAVQAQSPEAKSKVAAGLLGIFLGSLGIHKFYLGYTSPGVIMLLVSLVGGAITCGVATGVMSIIGLIEGIVYLVKSDADFHRIYVEGRKGWF